MATTHPPTPGDTYEYPNGTRATKQPDGSWLYVTANGDETKATASQGDKLPFTPGWELVEDETYPEEGPSPDDHICNPLCDPDNHYWTPEDR